MLPSRQRLLDLVKVSRTTDSWLGLLHQIDQLKTTINTKMLVGLAEKAAFSVQGVKVLFTHSWYPLCTTSSNHSPAKDDASAASNFCVKLLFSF
jgi:hypothetical protein